MCDGRTCQQIIVIADDDVADSPFLGKRGTIEVIFRVVVTSVFSRLDISVINGNGECVTLGLGMVKLLLTYLDQRTEWVPELSCVQKSLSHSKQVHRASSALLVRKYEHDGWAID